MQIAVFDVCDTIYKVNTTFSFLDHFFANNKRYIFFRSITKFFPVKVFNYFFYKLFKKDIMRYCGTLFLKGIDVEKVQKYSHKFVYTDLVKEIKEPILAMLEHYKNQGYKIVLMSGSYTFVIEEVAKYFNVDYFYASKLNIVNKFYTGKYDKDILLTKYDLLKKDFNQINKLVVVSNNKTDLELMQSADKSFAICNKENDTKFWEPYSNITCIKDY
ncbi:HAD-IB family phosphatase [Candidatus Pelagibacter sp.]|nr:HAD-IB family phosphatase [Candidatus Pelagibacter sp.]